MIDRSHAHVCLRPRNLLTALGISCALFSILLIIYLICVLAGVIAFGGCWLVVILLGILVYGIVLVLGLGILIAGCASGEGVGVVVGLVVGGLILIYGVPWSHRTMTEFYPPYHQAALTSWDTCYSTAKIFLDFWVTYQIYLYSWIVLAVALSAAAGVLAFLGILRCETWFKAAFLKIRYTCPKCHTQALPSFCCSNPDCLFTHDDLKPTVYGVWNASCGKCNTLLPASDLAGRLNLKAVCSVKGCDPNFSSLGMYSEYHFAVVGASNSGKTNFMVTALRALIETFAPAHGITVRLASPAEEQEYQQKLQDLEKGQVLGQTVRVEQPMAFNLVLEPSQGAACNLYLYDAAGEDFQAGDLQMTGHTFHRYIDGILLVVDPAAEEELRRQHPDIDWQSMNPARTDANEIVGRMIPFWERILNVGSGRPFAVPIGVIVAKMDGLAGVYTPGVEEMNGTYADLDKAADAAAAESAQARQFLIDGGLATLAQNLESRFPQLAYFTVSALGRSQQPGNTSSFESRGVLSPLFWICHQAGALTDASSIARGLRHLGMYLNGMLAGREGRWAAATLWSVTVTGLTSIVMALWYYFDEGGLLSGLAAAFAATVIWYVQTMLPAKDRQRFRQEFGETARRLRASFAGQNGKRARVVAWTSGLSILTMLLIGAGYLWWPLMGAVLVAAALVGIVVRKSGIGH